MSGDSDWSWNRRSILVLAAVVLVAAVVGRLANWFSEWYTLATFDCGDGKKIDLLTEAYWNPGWKPESAGLYYSVSQGRASLVPLCWIPEVETLESTARVTNWHFRSVHSAARSLWGVVAAERPTQVFLLHDFDTGASYPSMFASPSATREDMAAWYRLRRRLERDNPEIAKTRKLVDTAYVRRPADRTDPRPARSDRFPWLDPFELDLSYSDVTDEDLRLPQGTRLTGSKVSLEGTSVSDRGIAALAETADSLCLRYLNLDFTRITDACVSALLRLGLDRVEVRGTELSAGAIAELRRGIHDVVTDP